ncbi:unnamed protein product [Oppiella nova]|uniref:DUF8206 domain-containing protein n=1 Tax=Oppiella nova TaxID=334625 RepID=A0A7R9QSM1_9ACAR|nr:unnamed protein product [Oppiella nova]CAG2173909.1 unnamed protein product [Oppiella nova]
MSNNEITILLLGESGVGKTHFINAFANYLNHADFGVGSKHPICVSPIDITIMDHDTLESINVKLIDNGNQKFNANGGEGEYPKCYTFRINDLLINIIDTPDIERDGNNERVIMDFISNYRKINAILSHLNKSATDNILFLFENTYRPGNSVTVLIAELKSTTKIDIKFNKDKIFCINYESFNYAISVAPPNNVNISPDIRVNQDKNWKRYPDRETYEQQTVTLGKFDKNEFTQDTTKSVTQYPKCYKFEIGDVKLNIIDTPGIADTKGIDKDNANMRNILDFISNYQEINAICVLLKPNNARVSIVFQYCLFQLFSHLNKSAADNILFLFTNARNTQYAPGDTGPALHKLLDDIKAKPPYVDIKYHKSTIYCFDNEAFRFAVASAPPNNMVFDGMMTRDYEVSWETSVTECDRLLGRIISLPPHTVMDTLSLNNAKQNILLLTQPLADITKNISDNMKECERHKQRMKNFTGDITALKAQLYIPSLDIETIELDHPKTVCGDKDCCTQENINGTIKTHYKTDCHSPCYLRSSDGGIIGNEGLRDCEAFQKSENIGEAEWRVATNLLPDQHVEVDERGMALVQYVDTIRSENCFGCGHSYKLHLHIKYDTRIVKREVRDERKYERISTRNEANMAQQNQIKQLELKIQELSNENDIITTCMAKFACFLKNNALTPFNDAFEGYVKLLIEQEKQGDKGSVAIINLERVLTQYTKEKQVILDAMNKAGSNSNQSDITIKDIDESIKQLKHLKWKGAEISQLFEKQLKAKEHSHVHQEESIDTSTVKGSKNLKFWKNYRK